MKKLILTACAVMVVLGAQAQGYFTFNTRPDAAHQITFTDAGGTPLSGANFWVEVFAGKDAASLQPLGSLALNRTGAGAGLTQPFLSTYTVTGMTQGQSALVGYQAFQGDSTGNFSAATVKSALVTTLDNKGATPLTVSLQEAPNLPNTVTLVSGPLTVSLVPEPGTLALGLLGLASLLAIRRRS